MLGLFKVNPLFKGNLDKTRCKYGLELWKDYNMPFDADPKQRETIELKDDLYGYIWILNG